MGGIRIGGVLFVPSCSPPLGLRDTSNNFNVFRACTGDAAGEATQISDFSDGGAVVDGVSNVRLSPDGTKILFQYANATNGLDEVWVVSSTPGSTAVQLVSDGTDSAFHPSWGPDSDTFLYVQAFGSTPAQNGTIFKDTVSSPGSPVSLKAAAGGVSPYRPQFNFDGTRVAYIWDNNIPTPGADLRVMDADGTNDSSLDNTIGGYNNSNPPAFGWANAQNTICYSNTSNDAWVINDDGSGKTQINTAGAASGDEMFVTSDCWAPDDTYVVVTASLGFSYKSLVRAEIDGSNTTSLNASHGAMNQNWMRGAYIYNGRIWFIETASASNGGKVSSVLLDGTDYRVDLDVNAGSALNWISSGDGFVWN